MRCALCAPALTVGGWVVGLYRYILKCPDVSINIDFRLNHIKRLFSL